MASESSMQRTARWVQSQALTSDHVSRSRSLSRPHNHQKDRTHRDHSAHQSLQADNSVRTKSHRKKQSVSTTPAPDAPNAAVAPPKVQPQPQPSRHPPPATLKVHAEHRDHKKAPASPASSSTLAMPPAPAAPKSSAQTQSYARPFIPTAVYQTPNLPAFVQGPPGSGYPMPMTASVRPSSNPVQAVPRKPPSPPISLPSPLNPKKSRPTEFKRRPSLSRSIFDPPTPPPKDVAAPTQERRPRRRAMSDANRR